MTKRHTIGAATCAILILLTLAIRPSAIGQGSLIPPGAPAPSMKTLEQLEPRIPVNATTTPGDGNYRFIIAAPGSYYLTDNLLVTNAHGIDIRAAGVTLDLMGYEIRRTAGSGGNGIEIDGASYRSVVRNGSVTGFGSGVNASLSPESGRFESLIVMGCSGTGLFAGRNWTVVDCTAFGNTNAGIRAGYASRLTRCTAGNNGGGGIVADSSCVLVQCVATGNDGTYGIFAGRGAVLEKCTAGANSTTYGIYASIGSLLSGCSVYQNNSGAASGYGIYTEERSVVEGCVVSQSTSSFGGVDSDPTDNGVGIHVQGYSIVRNSATAVNEGDGIRCAGDCLIVDNNSGGNGGGAGLGAAIHVVGLGTTVKANVAKDSDYGIKVDFSSNLIVGNMAQSNGTNYVMVSNNRVGAIVVAPASGAISGSTGGAGVGTADPWGNISY